MRNLELSILNDWRFCNVKHLDKIPYPNNWQNTPLTLQHVSSTNVGVILGSHSNGLCAIDFDGIEAIDHWSNTFDIDIADLNTVMWTSGKEYRCQIAFTIPNEYWDILKRKVVNKLEFRWNCQSVLPPSKLNDGREYVWLKSPTNYKVQQLPDQVLAYWLKLIYDDITRYDVEYVQKSYSKNFDEELINELLSRISRKVGNLRGDYDVWRTIAWATCHSVGINTAQMLMLYYWPEKTKKEMHTLRAWKHTHRGPTIGTLIKLAGLSKLEHKLLEIQYKKRKLQ